MKAAQVAMLRPCAKCPFRRDVCPYITPARVIGIWQAARQGTHFVCHETVDYDALEDGRADEGPRRACAGFLAMAQREGIDTQIVQVARRLAGMELAQACNASLVWPSIKAMVAAHKKLRKPKNSR